MPQPQTLTDSPFSAGAMHKGKGRWDWWWHNQLWHRHKGVGWQSILGVWLWGKRMQQTKLQPQRKTSKTKTKQNSTHTNSHMHVRMHTHAHTPSITFQHLSPNSARFGYATEGAFFISMQLFADAFRTLRKVWVLIGLWKPHNTQVPT